MSSTFSRIGEYGRLGNQLWQYAFLRGFQLKTGEDVFLPIVSEKVWHGQPCLLNCFNLQIRQEFSAPPNLKTWIEKDPQEFDESVYNYRNCDFVGFFQNTKYFEHCKDLLKQEFTLKANFNTVIKDSLKKLKVFSDRELVSIHIRRGDLVEQTKNDNFFGGPDSIYFQYLNKALEFFPKDKYAFLIFTGGSRENDYKADVEWCKSNLPFDWENDYVHVHSTGNPILDFGLISGCDHNIMCHASSFSWWAAYLNKNPTKIVIAPKNYFIDRRERYVDGFYPVEFTLI